MIMCRRGEAAGTLEVSGILGMQALETHPAYKVRFGEGARNFPPGAR